MDENVDIFNLRDRQPMPSRGSLLVAKPTVEDPIFKRSVSIIVDHDDIDGTMALVVNNPVPFTLGEVMPELATADPVPLYLGGPVGTDQLFFLHTLGPEVVPGGDELAPGIFMGGDFEALKAYVGQGLPIEGKVKFIVGYGGWTVGQLAGEVARHDWAVTPGATPELIFQTESRLVWDKAVDLFGDSYSLWHTWPRDVDMN